MRTRDHSGNAGGMIPQKVDIKNPPQTERLECKKIHSRRGKTIANMKKYIGPLVLGIVLIGLIAVMFQWFETRDAQINATAQAYEKCVEAEYGTTPTAWYVEHGEYPPCEPKPSLEVDVETENVLGATAATNDQHKLIQYANADRASNGIESLIESPVLNDKAKARADSLCASGQWSHEGWEDYFEGTHSNYAGENLAKGFPDAGSAHDALMASPTHRETS